MAPFFLLFTFNLIFVLKFDEDQMRKFVVLLLLFTSALLLKSQSQLDSLALEREMVYKKYREHKDTMTINTWMNIFKLNKYLGQMVVLDSLIIAEKESGNSEESQKLEVTQSKLESLLNEKIDMNRRLSEAENSKHALSKNLRIVVIAGGVSLLFLILFLVSFILMLNKLKKSKPLVQEYHTNLYNAKSEIEKLLKDQENMATDFNNREKSFDNEMRKMREGMDTLSDEKTMLENQIIEVKKAYDREVEKRLTAEERLQSIKNHHVENMPVSAAADETPSLKLQNEECQKLKLEIEKERKIRINIENELKNLLETLREHSL